MSDYFEMGSMLDRIRCERDQSGLQVTQARECAKSLVGTLQAHRYRIPPDIVSLFSLEILRLCRVVELETLHIVKEPDNSEAGIEARFLAAEIGRDR